MALGIAEDFTSNIELDSQLKSTPTSGLYLNSGTHPSITLHNLLAFLPYLDITFEDWDSTKTYGVFDDTRNRSDIVTVDNVLYQSIQAGTNQNPTAANSTYWIKTNIESLRLKDFLRKVQDRFLSELSLTKRLINNQYLYDSSEATNVELAGNYAGWGFEPKGSDYVTIRINEMSLQKDGTNSVNVYIVNQGQLIETFQIAANNGRTVFTEVNKVLPLKGVYYVVIDSTTVKVGDRVVDPLTYDGMVVYPVVGIGSTPQGSEYDISYHSNGIGINISCYLNSDQYVENNLRDFGDFLRATAEYMTFQMFEHNPNNRSNRAESIQMRDEILSAELRDTKVDTVISRFYKQKKKAMEIIEKTFDTQLSDGHSDDSITIETSSV